jgi:hypothetical protein
MNRMTQIVVSNSAENVLSKQQQQFNKLIASVEKLKKDIDKETDRLDKTLNDFVKKVLPIKEKTLVQRFELIKILDKLTLQKNFEHQHLKAVKNLIQFNFDELFAEQEATQEQEELYNKWSNQSYKDELSAEVKDKKKEMQEMIKNMTGIDVDLSKYEDTDEGHAQFMADFGKIMTEHEGQKVTANQLKKKTKAQIKKEAELALQEEIKSKNLRSIYVTLAKLLHPDTETDETLKKEKEEIMKQVTVAYENNDIAALLSLEIEWVHKNNNKIHQLKDDVLKAYCNVLKEQVEDLKLKKESLISHPKYRNIISNDKFGFGFGFGVINTNNKLSKYNKTLKLLNENIEITNKSITKEIGINNALKILSKERNEIIEEQEMQNLAMEFMNRNIRF